MRVRRAASRRAISARRAGSSARRGMDVPSLWRPTDPSLVVAGLPDPGGWLAGADHDRAPTTATAVIASAMPAAPPTTTLPAFDAGAAVAAGAQRAASAA